MARRTQNTKNDTASTEAVNTEAPQEDAVSTNTEASPEATEAPAEKPIDLTAFNGEVEKAVAEADTTTGVIAEQFVDAVLKEYRNLEGAKAKNAAKAALAEGMRKAMDDGSIAGARSYLQLTDSMSAGPSGSAPKAPVDPTEAFVQADATLRLALALHTPTEGVSEDYAEKVEALVTESTESAEALLAWVKSDAEDKGDEPEASPVVKNAVKLALGKAAKAGGRAGGVGGATYNGARRDIGKHIANAFADKESGDFLTVAEIRTARSDEYGDNPPSAGAISARLFPPSGKCTVEGVVPGENDKGIKGAAKA